MKKWIKIALIAAVAAVLIAGIALGWYLWRVHRYQANVAALTYQDIDITKISDGVYLGSCDEDFVAADVRVTVQGGRLVKIELLRHKTERGAKAESIINEMLQKQTTDVDVISGATNSSKVIKKAVENALLGRKPT